MARGHLTILSQRNLAELQSHDPNHPRIRRHRAAVSSIEEFRRRYCNSGPDAQGYIDSTVPKLLREICTSQNKEYLCLPTDLKLSPLCIWRILLRSKLSLRTPFDAKRSNNIPKTASHPSHHALVIRRRETIVRRIDEDFSETNKVSLITQPKGVAVMYFAENLHSNPHSSIGLDEVPPLLYRIAPHLDHNVLSPDKASKDGIVSSNGVCVHYSHSPHLINLEAIISGESISWTHNRHQTQHHKANLFHSCGTVHNTT